MNIDSYMMGSCHHFAVALHRLTGMQLAAVVGTYRGKLAVYHVVCLDADGGAWDARGHHPRNDLIYEQEDKVWVKPLEGEHDVWSLAGNEYLHGLHEIHIESAMRDVKKLLRKQLTLKRGTPGPQDAELVGKAKARLLDVPDLSEPEPEPGPGMR